MSIDIKSAVQAARKHALELFEPESLPNLALEEITFDEPQGQWLVTLGFDSPHKITRKTNGSNLFPTVEEQTQREYKQFHIDATDGHLVSMTMR